MPIWSPKEAKKSELQKKAQWIKKQETNEQYHDQNLAKYPINASNEPQKNQSNTSFRSKFDF